MRPVVQHSLMSVFSSTVTENAANELTSCLNWLCKYADTSKILTVTVSTQANAGKCLFLIRACIFCSLQYACLHEHSISDPELSVVTWQSIYGRLPLDCPSRLRCPRLWLRTIAGKSTCGRSVAFPWEAHPKGGNYDGV